jgi:cell division septal protein FtsQ
MMKRSRVPRLAFDRLAPSSVLALQRPSRRSRGELAWAAQLLSLLTVAAAAIARAVRGRRRVRVLLLALAIALPLLFGAWRWFRSSSLVAVDRVQVSGVRGADAHEIEAALLAAAKRMTTLDANERSLLAAVAPYQLVRSLSVSTSFPHGMSIHVVEQLPVATLTVAGARTAVAADGAVLGPRFVSPRLATVSGAYLPPTGGRVHASALVGELEVLGAAPRALAPFIARASEGPHGLTISMRDGLEAYFGDSARARAKWIALCVVLSDSSSAHVAAVDVRSPERAAARFPSGYAPSSAAAGGEADASSAASSAESIASALAARLAESAGYGSSAEAQGASATAGAEASAPEQAQSEESGSSSSAEAGSSGGGEAAGSAGGEAPSSAGGGAESGG